MPMPLWFGHVNKRLFNNREIRKGIRPVLIHVGRNSGQIHETPLEVFPIEDGYLFVLMYGAGADWVRNVLAAGSARLRIGDQDIELSGPVVLTGENAWALLPDGTKRPPAWLNVTELLRMDAVAVDARRR